MRSRNWSLIVYDIPDITEYLNQRSNLLYHYIGICHDKDNSEIHYHFAITLKNALDEVSVRKKFASSTDSNCLAIRTDEKYKSRFYIIDYFLHTKETGKYRYSKDDLITDDINYWVFQEKINDSDIIKRKELILDFIHFSNADDGCLSRQDLYVKYGRDIVINFDRYLDFANECKHDFRKNTL